MLDKFIRACKYCCIGFVAVILSGCKYGVLAPAGIISNDQRTLLVDSLALMLVVVLPVIIMSFVFFNRYRQNNVKYHHRYRPDWHDNVFLECFWWGIPMVIIIVLGILTWKTTHSLDPYRPIKSKQKPLIIQAVALPWKWLFIYPQEHFATLNYLKMPVKRPVEFIITADAPMSSFIIPRLGGQIYAMAGMQTQLHLLAYHTGTYRGLNSQYNGNGFSDMKFKAQVVSESQYEQWKQSIHENPNPVTLDEQSYLALQKHSVRVKPVTYHSVSLHLFEKIVAHYRGHRHPQL